jgi:hypothetical protein
MLQPDWQRVIISHRRKAMIKHLERALNVHDTIRALIHQQRIIHYPKGTNITGVVRQYEIDRRRPIEEQWIREVHFFDELQTQFLIICCSYDQAKLFQDQKHIQMDLAFKMVQGKTRTFTIAGWNRDTRSTIHLRY